MIANSAAPSLFEECVGKIEEAEVRLGHKLGRRFLCVSRDVLEAPVQIAFLTLNPGGDKDQADHAPDSCEDGVAYLAERWNGCRAGEHKLQRQVRAMFRLIQEETGLARNAEELMSAALIAYFVPFRSPSWKVLCEKQESIKVSSTVWRRLLQRTSPILTICIGRVVQRELRHIIPDALCVEGLPTVKKKIGWGLYNAEIDDFRGAGHCHSLLYLPHLSRYSVFDRVESEQQMRHIIRRACTNLKG